MEGGQIEFQKLEVSFAKSPSLVLKKSATVDTAFICRTTKKDLFIVAYTKTPMETVDNLFDL